MPSIRPLQGRREAGAVSVEAISWALNLAPVTEGMLVLLIPVVKETQVTQKLIGERLHLPAGARIRPDSDHDRRYQLHPPAAKILSCPHPASVTGCALIWICATWWTML